jgi:MFS transporter
VPFRQRSRKARGGPAGTVASLLVVPLKQSLHIDNTQVGLLVTVSTGVGALATVVAGALADRTVRVRLLWTTLLVCSAAMALSAVSPSYGWLLACRVRGNDASRTGPRRPRPPRRRGQRQHIGYESGQLVHVGRGT